MRQITIIYHKEPEGWWAESPDVEGYGATGETLAELRDLVHDGMPFYLEDEEFDLREQMSDGSLVFLRTISFIDTRIEPVDTDVLARPMWSRHQV